MPVSQENSSFYYEPQVRYLYQVLEELGRGELRIPSFQRPFVWTDEDRTLLLESIRDGLPIGALFQWTTKMEVGHTEEEIAGKKVPTFEHPLRQYLLDGKQRMTTLFGALKTSEYWAAHYDLKEEQFLVGSRPHGKDDALGEKNRLLPMSVVLDTVALVRFQRGIWAEDEIETDAWVKRSDELAKAFREYRLSIVVITTDDVEIATKAFLRVNISGHRLTETHMVNALAWSREFSLVDKLEKLIAERLEPQGWGEIDEALLFRSVKVAMGFDSHEFNPDLIALTLSKRPEVLEEVGCAFVRAIEFLRSKGVHRPTRLPYTHQLQILAEAFRVSPQLTDEQKKRLFYWFQVTTFDETFSKLGGSIVAKMNAYVRLLLSDVIPTWPARRAPEISAFPERFDPRHARSRGILLLMRKPDGEAFRLFSRSELSSQKLYDSPANRILCASAEEALNVGDLLRGPAPLAQCPELLKDQVFPSDVLEAAIQRRWDDCVNLRTLALVKLEQDLFGFAWEKLNLDTAEGAPF